MLKIDLKELGLEENSALTPEVFVKMADAMFVQIDEAIKETNKNVKLTPDQKSVKQKKLEARKDVATFFKALGNGDNETLRRLENERIEANPSLKALNESVGSEGAFLVPVEFEKAIFAYDEQYDKLANDMSQHTMNSNVLKLNALSGEPTTYIVGELVEIDSSQPAFAEPTLTAKKYATIVGWSNEFGEDNEVPDFEGFLAGRIARSQALKFEGEIINGATAGSLGIMQAAGVTVVDMASGDTTFADITIDYLFDMITALGEIDELDLENAKFYMSRSVYAVLRKSKASTSGEYFLPVTGKDAEIGGVQIVLNNRFPKVSATAVSTKFVVLANFKVHGHVGNRAGVRMNIFNEGVLKAGGGTVNLITQDASAMRVIRRRAFVTALPNGIVILKTAAS